jgi:hypothetical protein
MTNQPNEGFLPEPGDVVDLEHRRYLVRRSSTDLTTYVGGMPNDLKLTFYLVDITDTESNVDELILRETL